MQGLMYTNKYLRPCIDLFEMNDIGLRKQSWNVELITKLSEITISCLVAENSFSFKSLSYMDDIFSSERLLLYYAILWVDGGGKLHIMV